MKKGVIESCGATCTSGSVAKTGTLASALYVIESAADGARLQSPHSEANSLYAKIHAVMNLPAPVTSGNCRWSTT